MPAIRINDIPLFQVDLPSMTLAQYNALPEADRPKHWIRTDLEYRNIPASMIDLSNGQTVEEAIATIPKIARGRASFTSSSQSVSLNYSSAGFTEAPTVMVVIEGSRSYARAEIGDSPLYVSNVTKNNCTVEVNRIANNNQIAFYYLAVGK